MTGLKALDLLRKGNVKVKRSKWRTDEYLYTHDHNDNIWTSLVYERKRGYKCDYPLDARKLTLDILEDFLRDDWEVAG
jgi:hypothetical protein